MLEYKIENISAWAIEKKLNELAREGWDFVSGFLDPMNDLTFIAVLKREAK